MSGLLCGLALLVLAACDLGSGPPPRPAALEIWAGDGQSATVFSAVAVPPAVRVLNAKGKPMRGREVFFSVTSGGGSVSGAAQVTDPSGVARVGAWILGTTTGPNTLEARVEGLAPVLFSATAVPGPPAQITAASAIEQEGVVGSEPAEAPTVRVVDTYGNPVPGQQVTFEVTGGGGSLQEATATTDGSGQASADHWTLGTVPGLNTLTAAVGGLPPVTFSALAVPDVPASVAVAGGQGQSAQVGTAVPVPPSVRVADRFGNPLEGVEVVFEPEPGSGSVSGGQALTSLDGVAVVGGWTLGTVSGAQALRAWVAEVDTVRFEATAVPGPPASAEAVSAQQQEATVGQPVPEPPSVRVRDEYGNPVPGVAVTFTETVTPAVRVASGTGLTDGAEREAEFARVLAQLDPGSPLRGPSHAAAETVTTGSEGIAAMEGWVLGERAGTYQLEAAVAGLEARIVFAADAGPGPPAALVKTGGDDQTGQVGATLPVSPSLRVEDQYGNGVPGVAVTFSVTEGGGTVSGAETTTDDEGEARVGSWTLGPAPGPNTLEAAVEGVGAVTFTATALAATPAALVKVAGDAQSTTVGSPVPTPPRVRAVDGGGQPVAWVTVQFGVVSGGGTVTGATVVTDAQGEASVGSWVLGTTAGPQLLRAEAEGVSPVTFVATATAGPPVAMRVHEGDGQVGQAGAPLPVPPSVRVEDTFGNPVGGVSVDFAVTLGGGSVSGTPATTNAAGVAAAGSWTLGPAAGPNELVASAAGLPAVAFHATGVLTSDFSLELQFLTSLTPSQESIFLSAASRWEEVVIGDLPDFTGTLTEGGCQPVTETGGVDDVKLYVSVVAIDGSGGVLGRAGPCYIWNNGHVFPITGILELDEADVADMEANGTLRDVVIHEMGHVLGIGTLWNSSPNAFLIDAGSADPYFNGSAAIAAFDAAGGSARPGPKVPVENTGGAGTRDAHWRETVHESELMTGWIEPPGNSNPLSAITIGSLADLGYVVNMAAADPYVLFDPFAPSPVAPQTQGKLFLEELPPPVPIPVGRVP